MKPCCPFSQTATSPVTTDVATSVFCRLLADPTSLEGLTWCYEIHPVDGAVPQPHVPCSGSPGLPGQSQRPTPLHLSPGRPVSSRPSPSRWPALLFLTCQELDHHICSAVPTRMVVPSRRNPTDDQVSGDTCPSSREDDPGMEPGPPCPAEALVGSGEVWGQGLPHWSQTPAAPGPSHSMDTWHLGQLPPELSRA